VSFLARESGIFCTTLSRFPSAGTKPNGNSHAISIDKIGLADEFSGCLDLYMLTEDQ
jgi:hypothetical protein